MKTGVNRAPNSPLGCYYIYQIRIKAKNNITSYYINYTINMQLNRQKANQRQSKPYHQLLPVPSYSKAPTQSNTYCEWQARLFTYIPLILSNSYSFRQESHPHFIQEEAKRLAKIQYLVQGYTGRIPGELGFKPRHLQIFIWCFSHQSSGLPNIPNLLSLCFISRPSRNRKHRGEPESRSNCSEWNWFSQTN